jgi:hypothetical protein
VAKTKPARKTMNFDGIFLVQMRDLQKLDPSKDACEFFGSNKMKRE